MSNLKLDIIYYKTSSDFEMEFNLSGCCRMRIFKEKVETQKDLVKTLARDVARSKIIIVVTDLFGAQNGVEIVSHAIGLPLCPLNKNEYGVNTAEDIMLPQTAVPLINKSGIYGGCILESGPQSIILVSSIRALRHEIMKAYIHNYIFDIAQIAAYNERMGNTSEKLIPPVMETLHNNHTENIISEVASDEDATNTEEPIEEPVVTATEEEPKTKVEETLESKTEEAAEGDTVENTISDTQAIANSNEFAVSVEPGINFLEDISSDSDTSTEHYPRLKKKKKGLNIVLLVLAVLLLVCFGVLAYFFIYLPLIGEDSALFVADNFITDFLKEWFFN